MTHQTANFGPEIPEALEVTLLTLLQQNDTLKEHELMRQLTDQGYTQFSPSLEPLALFQAHFLLFHILYRLQDKWREEKRGLLSIFTLEIKLTTFEKSPGLVISEPQDGQKLAEQDPLKSYYLDFDAYLATQEQEVIDLLASFWQQLGNLPPSQEVEQALKQLELEVPFTLEAVNRRYRQLAQVHHPDKGGNTEFFQQISQAADCLRQWLKQNP